MLRVFRLPVRCRHYWRITGGKWKLSRNGQLGLPRVTRLNEQRKSLENEAPMFDSIEALETGDFDDFAALRIINANCTYYCL